MSETERLLVTDAASTASVNEQRRQLNKRFYLHTAVLLGVCGVMLSCHTQLDSIKLNAHDDDGAASPDDSKVAADVVPSGESSGSHAALISLQDVPTSAMGLNAKRLPSWWNNTEYLPDAQPIFIHIPKTGGVSVEDMASKAGHVTGACLVHSFGDDAVPYALAKGYLMEPYHTPPARFVPYSFTVVRNPYARMVSEFNWVSLYDPVKAADIRAGKWTFSCDDFQTFVENRVDGLTGSPRYQCLQEEGFTAEGYDVCDGKGLGTIDDSHAIPQWLFAKNAERVFRYEDYDKQVWPFLRGVGVLGSRQTPEKVNSAGAVSETAAKCWAFVSNEVIAKFVALYAMDFKNLGYPTTAFSHDSASATLGLLKRKNDGIDKKEEGGVSVTITAATAEVDEAVSSLGFDEENASEPLSEEVKAKVRAALLNVDISGIDMKNMRAGLADEVWDTGSLGEDEAMSEVEAAAPPSVQTEEKNGRSTPGCVKAGKLQALGSGEKEGWTPPSWAVVEGVLRRGVFQAQSLAQSLKTTAANAASSLSGSLGASEAVTAAVASVEAARDLAEAAARNPIGMKSGKVISATVKAAKLAAKSVKDASSVIASNVATPQSTRDEFASHASTAAEMHKALAQAMKIRRAREMELLKLVHAKRQQKSTEADTAALAGYL